MATGYGNSFSYTEQSHQICPSMRLLLYWLMLIRPLTQLVFPLHHLITEFTGLLEAHHHRNGYNLWPKAIRKEPALILTLEVPPGLVQ
jgi:hypothetical protein